MATEAQLCPQCGAALQFAEGQTEVVCPHCGTTVSRLAATPSAAQELEEEKLVQETKTRQGRLFAEGRLAIATVVAVQMSNIRRQGLGGEGVLMTFKVDVQPEGEAPFSAEARAFVGLTAVEKYRAGTVLDVRYDPKDRTQVSLAGRHGDPSSNPIEAARQKWDKEQAEQQAQEQASAQALAAAAAEPLAPAWGGARPAGSVPTPFDFDRVTGLGPAASVHEPQGRHLPHLGTPHASRLVVYRDGFAFQTGGKEVHTWRYDAVTAVQSNVAWPPHSPQLHEYALSQVSGEKLILDDGLVNVEEAAEAIKTAVFAHLAPPLIPRYQAGEAMAFGPVTVQRQAGLRLDGMASATYAWDAIQDIQVDDGLLKLTMRDGKKHEARASAIPNIEVLCQLIGVRMASGDLEHIG